MKQVFNIGEIEIEYVERGFLPTENTGITLYDKYKVSVLLSSGILFVLNNRTGLTEKGDFLTFRPDEIHFGRIVKEKTYRFLNILIPTDYFEKLNLNTKIITDFLTHTEKGNHTRPKTSDKEKILLLCERLIKNLKNDSTDISSFVDLLNLLLILSEIYADKSTEEQTEMPVFVAKILEYIADNFSSKITLDDLAKNAYCSVAYLSKIFKEYMGCTVYEHLTNYRIINAEKLLIEGKSVTEASYECGFNDCSHFIRTFKKITGKTPYNYKKK